MTTVSGLRFAHVKNQESSNTVLSVRKPGFKLTFTFPAANCNKRYFNLSSLGVSRASEKLCLEGIIKVRYNRGFVNIAVEIRYSENSEVLLVSANLRGMPVKVYEPLPCQCVRGLIRLSNWAIVEYEGDFVWGHATTSHFFGPRMSRRFCICRLPNAISQFLGE